MIIRPTPEWPVELAIGLGDRVFVDAGDTAAHQAVRVEFPILVAIGTEPGVAVVAIFAPKPHGA